MQCPICKSEAPAAPSICPHCGSFISMIPQAQPSPVNARAWTIRILFLITVLIISAVAVTNPLRERVDGNPCYKPDDDRIAESASRLSTGTSLNQTSCSTAAPYISFQWGDRRSPHSHCRSITTRNLKSISPCYLKLHSIHQ